MTNKHTPTPWKFFNEGNGYLIIDDNSDIIGSVRAISNFGDYSESKANAHLLAAAPELLTALETADKTLAKCDQDMVGATRLKIRSVIKKANRE